MPNKDYSRNAEQKLEVVKYAENYGNAAVAKRYLTDESNIRLSARTRARFGQQKKEEPD